jgi:hypothetical protein
MSEIERRIIHVNANDELDLYDIFDNKSIDEVLKHFNEVKNSNWRSEVKKVYFKVTSWGEGYEIETWVEREETDEEERVRLIHEKAASIKKEKEDSKKEIKERALFEELKLKYGDNK